MDVLQHAEVLRKIPLFKALDAAQLKLLAFTSEVYEYNNNEYLCHQGETSDSIFVILDGEVEILDVSGDEPVTLATVGTRSLLGEMAVLRRERRSASVKSIGRVEALKITNDRFIDLITGNPKMALFVMRDLSTKLALANDRVVALQAEVNA